MKRHSNLRRLYICDWTQVRANGMSTCIWVMGVKLWDGLDDKLKLLSCLWFLLLILLECHNSFPPGFVKVVWSRFIQVLVLVQTYYKPWYWSGLKPPAWLKISEDTQLQTTGTDPGSVIQHHTVNRIMFTCLYLQFLPLLLWLQTPCTANKACKIAAFAQWILFKYDFTLGLFIDVSLTRSYKHQSTVCI